MFCRMSSILIIMILSSFNVFANTATNELTTVIIQAPQFIQSGPPKNPYDYTICGFPNVCNAGSTVPPYIPKPIGLARSSAPLTPEWQNPQWQCVTGTPKNCYNTDIHQTSPSSLVIVDNVIYATLGVDKSNIGEAPAAKILQMSKPIPAGWSCIIKKDNSNQTVAICNTVPKLLWTCQPTKINCAIVPGACNGIACFYMCDFFSANKYSLIAGEQAYLGSYNPEPKYFSGWHYSAKLTQPIPTYTLKKVSYENSKLICHYDDDTTTYTVDGVNCTVGATVTILSATGEKQQVPAISCDMK